MQHYLCGGMVTMSPIPTLRAMMLSDRQPFADSSKAIGTDLASTVGIDLSKVHPTLPADPLGQKQKLSKGSINTIFS
jgi:hypothetical protein